MYEQLETYFQQKLSLTEVQFAEITALLTPKSVRKGELVVRQGEVGRYGAFVAKGCLRSYVIDKKEKEHILQFAPENWWIADQNSILHNEPAMFYIDALEDSEVFLFGSAFFQKLQAIGPEFQSLFYTLLQNSVRSMQKRLISTLSATAEERYLEFIHTYPTLALRLPQRMIAAYLGVTPESLSRIRKELSIHK
ncbi:Crp/Fnr family transcriptional regulator [Hymenobacter jejuensis]|uniref:Crp/Fnr family transcriptional regulator n=1 Tax=Hymenobacter jejuensis TaxID=2502781 RepID=A0A5B8A2K7_9BACT|nr:Crp/Fnr family transcriptional regulator [Hymenobacter jejuensis]QDA61520.1 Crp/Fnr family transcriptional regulator [Hymenobacter jejuensis]